MVKEEPKIRCLACNVALTDFESTRKSGVTKEYLDLCTLCLKEIEGYYNSEFVWEEREDLRDIIPVLDEDYDKN